MAAQGKTGEGEDEPEAFCYVHWHPRKAAVQFLIVNPCNGLHLSSLVAYYTGSHG